MKSKSLLFYIAAALIVLFAACEKDNLKYPESNLSGNVTYNGKPIGLRSAGAFQLELWQRGFANFTKIGVIVDQNGHYSRNLFDGDYKLVRLAGTFPWVEMRTDSIDVHLVGNAVIDVPVSPYFMLSDVSFVKNGTASVTATFTVKQTTVVTGKNLDQVKLYFGSTTIVDEINNVASANRTAANITIGTPTTITLNIPAALVTKGYLFARVGVKTSGVTELIYETPQKITLL